MENAFRELIAKLAITSDNELRADIVRKIIYRAADFISVGTKIVGVVNTDTLELKYHIPSELSAEYPVAEGAVANVDNSITWTDFVLSLKKAEVPLFLTDEAKIRQFDNQWAMVLRRAGEALAKAKDQNILTTLASGNYSSNTHAASAKWNTSSGDPAGDIAKALEGILQASGVNDSDIRNVAVVVPVQAWGYLMKTQDIENVRTNLINWFKESYGIEFYPTKWYDTYAVVLIKGEGTAIHGVYNGKDVPLSEEFRHPGMTEYRIRQYFNTVVVPESSSVTTSKRIYKITSIL